ncbi:MAG TPA: STAS domain-containing protein [Halanaerobiales bacterium]|nr:STAS domain-containing protein [Halanaerobiales bacterium]
MEEKNFKFIVDEREVPIMKFNGEIVFENSNELKETAKEKIRETEYQNLIMDFEDVSFIDSSGIGFILSLFKFLREREGGLVIANANEKIKKSFNITKISQIINIFDSVDEAYNNLK